MNTRFLFIGGFVLTVGTISYYEIKQCHELPWPPRIVATGAVFALLDVFSLALPELSGVIAIGFALAMILNTLNPTVQDRKLSAKVECNPKKKGCPCYSQATETVGIPPPAVVGPNEPPPFFPSRPQLPSGTPELPPGIEPPPELPAVPL